MLYDNTIIRSRASLPCTGLFVRERAGPRKKRAGDDVREKEKDGAIAFSLRLFFLLILFVIGGSLCE